MENKFNTNELLAAIQKSMLGYVRSDLRAVLLSITANYINIKFVLDHDPTEEDSDFYSEALLDFAANIPSYFVLNENFIYSNLPNFQLSSENEIFVFLRYED